jgi:hypothetical protein
VLLSLEKSKSRKDEIFEKSWMTEPNTSVASCAFVPQEKQIGKKLICVKIPDARTQYKSGLMCFCPSRKASPEKT